MTRGVPEVPFMPPSQLLPPHPQPNRPYLDFYYQRLLLSQPKSVCFSLPWLLLPEIQGGSWTISRANRSCAFSGGSQSDAHRQQHQLGNLTRKANPRI